jgi:LysR family nod box-dependent transcriptional activator
MHFRGLDLNLLIALDALLTERNVTRAAERIGISQPGMSAALQKLRYHFSDKLLDRVGRRLELTSRARELTSAVKDVLSRIDALANATPVFDPAKASRTFAVAMSTYCADVIGDLLGTYLLKNAPEVSCHIDDLAADSLLELDNGKYDFCITVAQRAILDPTYREGSLLEKHLFTDDFVVVAAKSNKAFKAIETFGDFCELPYVEAGFSNKITSMVEYALLGQPCRPKTRMTVPSFWNALTLVSRSELVSIVPRRLFDRTEKRFGVQSKPLSLPIPVLDETLIWHMRANDDPGNIWFRNVLESVCSDIV